MSPSATQVLTWEVVAVGDDYTCVVLHPVTAKHYAAVVVNDGTNFPGKNQQQALLRLAPTVLLAPSLHSPCSHLM